MSGKTASISRECACPQATTSEPRLARETYLVSVWAEQGIKLQSCLSLVCQRFAMQLITFLLELPSFGSACICISSFTFQHLGMLAHLRLTA